MNRIYLIRYNDNIIGAYTDYEMAETFIKSCIQNKLMIESATIITFKTNSCLKISTSEVSFEDPLNNNDNVNLRDELLSITHQLNIINNTEKLLHESTEKYKSDKLLYEKFKQELITDPNFIIPELFLDTFNKFKEAELKE